MFFRKPQLAQTMTLVGIFLFVVVDHTLGKDTVIIKKFEVAPYVERMATVKMTCEHNLRPERLYSVRWQHNNQDFYKYAADEETDKKMTFPELDLNVDLDASSETTVTLQAVNLTASGVYKCIVTAESPDFDRASKEGRMVVTVIPISKPVIDPRPGNDLRIGSEVNLNCSTVPSIPAAEVEWEINGKKAPDEYLKHYEPLEDEEGLFTSRLGLRFTVEKKHFRNSEMNLKCTAKIATLYAEYDEHSHQSPFPQNPNEAPAQSAIGNNLMNNEGGTPLLWVGLLTLPLALGIGR